MKKGKRTTESRSACLSTATPDNALHVTQDTDDPDKFIFRHAATAGYTAGIRTIQQDLPSPLAPGESVAFYLGSPDGFRAGKLDRQGRLRAPSLMIVRRKS